MRAGVALLPTNYGDWARFRGGGKDASQPPPDSNIYAEDLALGGLAEPLGFDSLWTVEHHFSPLTIVPNPLQFLTYFAGRTERIDLGTMVIVLPWHDPVRVAEEVAMLDNMLGGRRLTVGVGRGSGRREFEGLRVPPGDAAARFTEALEIMRRALSQRRFSFEGECFRIPEMELRPQPRSADLVERMCIAAMNSETIPEGAELGLQMLVGNQKPWEQCADDVQRFNAVRAEHGWEPVQPTVLVSVHCREDSAEAHEATRLHWGEQLLSITHHYERESTRAAREASARLQASGTPDEVIAKLREIRSHTRAGEFALMLRFGGMSAADAERSMHLVAAEVLPELHRWPQEA